MPDQSMALVDLITASLTPEGPSLVSNLDALSAALVAAVPSFLGFNVHAADYAFSWGPGRHRAAEHALVASSLTWHVSATTGPLVKIVLFAGLPGAWVDLAADLAWLTGASSERLLLDRDLASRFPVEQTGPPESRIINQAVGVLMAGGRSPEEALADLDLRAPGEQTDRAAAARRLLDDLDADTAPAGPGEPPA